MLRNTNELIMFADGYNCCVDDNGLFDQHLEKLRSDLNHFIECGDESVFDTDSGDRNDNQVNQNVSVV